RGEGAVEFLPVVKVGAHPARRLGERGAVLARPGRADVAGRELVVGAVLPGEKALRERLAGDDAYAAGARERQDPVRDPLRADAEGDLDRLEDGRVERGPALVERVDRD